MRTYDFAPLFRSTVGFDRLFSMLDQAARVEPSTQWPPVDLMAGAPSPADSQQLAELHIKLK